MAENIKIIRGDSAEIDVKFEDADGVAIDLTGKEVFFTVKSINDIDSTNDDNAKIKKDITIHTNPTAGETKIVLSPTETAITPGEYTYDLQVVSGGDVISTNRDYLEIIQDVTKRVE